MKRTPKPELIRINRYLSMCEVASRRKADEMVWDGKVEINRKVVRDVGTKIDPLRDRVYVNGQQVVKVRDYVYLVMNKPKDTITTLNDERGRTTVTSLLHTKNRVFPVGRLDRNTTGVLLFTNDGDFANRLMHPKFEVPKSYLVTCETAVEAGHLRLLQRGIALEDGKTSPADVFVMPHSKGREIGITIHEGRNRQVRRMFEHFGYEVTKLDRVAYGPVTKEGLARGATRKLTHGEVHKLKELAGMPPA